MNKDIDKLDNLIHDNARLKELQALPLERKILITQTRMIEWYKYWNGKCYVSFSGGKDSTVCADIAAQVCKILGFKLILWFSDTGLEYPEIKENIYVVSEYLKNKYNIEIELIKDYPKDKDGNRISFRQVIEQYGYPLISKEVSRYICVARNCPNGKVSQKFIPNNSHDLKYGMGYSMVKWNDLKDSDIPISHMCCDVMKKKPSKKFEKETGLKPIIATMACESRLRKNSWLKNGCNAFNAKRQTSQPMSFWSEQDVLKYIKENNLPLASVYGEIKQDSKGKYYTTGVDRTGCVFCCYGCHLEKEPNKFQKLKETHPKLYEYCMRDWKDGGLGLKDVLDYINVKY